jgi:hypothetical protein
MARGAVKWYKRETERRPRSSAPVRNLLCKKRWLARPRYEQPASCFQGTLSFAIAYAVPEFIGGMAARARDVAKALEELRKRQAWEQVHPGQLWDVRKR